MTDFGRFDLRYDKICEKDSAPGVLVEILWSHSMGATTECALAYFGLFFCLRAVAHTPDITAGFSLGMTTLNPPVGIRPRSSTAMWVMVTGENKEVGFCGFVVCVCVCVCVCGCLGFYLFVFVFI